MKHPFRAIVRQLVVATATVLMAAAAPAQAQSKNTLPQENPVAWSGAVEGHHQSGYEFDRARLEAGFIEAIDAWTEEAAEVLTSAGIASEAARLRKEWQAQSIRLFSQGGIDILDVGDYQPLNAWFAATHKRLRERFATVVGMVRILDDLNTLNYTIPVVFFPKGNSRTGETWDANEYRMHFVPFAGIVTYWGSFGACRLATAKNPKAKKFCGRAARLLAQGMTRFLAPALADRIYKRSHHLLIETYDFNLDAAVDQYLKELPLN